MLVYGAGITFRRGRGGWLRRREDTEGRRTQRKSLGGVVGVGGIGLPGGLDPEEQTKSRFWGPGAPYRFSARLFRLFFRVVEVRLRTSATTPNPARMRSRTRRVSPLISEPMILAACSTIVPILTPLPGIR